MFRSARTVPPRDLLGAGEDDDGLAGVLGSQSAILAREAALADAGVLQAVRETVRAGLPAEFLDPFAPAAARTAEVARVLRAAIGRDRSRGGPLGRVPNDDETLAALFAATLGWGPAQRYLDDPAVNEVKIIGRAIRVQEAGRPFVTAPELFADAREVLDRATLLASLLGVQLDAQTPQATIPVAHGTRMHVSIPPRTVDGALVCIRRGRQAAWDLRDLVERGTLDEPAAELLRVLLAAQPTLLIAGRTGSGKTGLLEALANEWPGEPHILTIEDHTMEIGIRRTAAWTRELVDTQRDPAAFGRVAREALRQTPDLLLPGEVRGNEAGAILALALTGHPVMTTIHARGPAEALERFANCAALPDAYMYAGRRDALRDACSAIDAVIVVDFADNYARRLVTSVTLVDGAQPAGSGWQPRLVPLLSLAPDASGVAWQLHARPAAEGALTWHDGHDHTPAGLAARLRQARSRLGSADGRTTLEAVEQACSRAEQLLQAGDAERALAAVRAGWLRRRDPRLVVLAERVLAQQPDLAGLRSDAVVSAHAELEVAVAARRWDRAAQLLAILAADPGVLAGLLPMGAWEALDARIAAGQALLRRADGTWQSASAALARGEPRAALDLVAAMPVDELPRGAQLALLRMREQALELLVARGEATPAALELIRAQWLALQQEAHPCPPLE